MDYIGLRIARWRDTAGLTQRELGERVGVSGAYVSMVENGERALTKRSRLIAFATALGVSITDLTAQPLRPRSDEEFAIYRMAPAVRDALDEQVPDEFESWPVDRIRAEVDTVMALRMACDYRTLSGRLPEILRQTRVLVDLNDIRGMRMFGRVAGAAAMAIKSFGHVDLGIRLAERVQQIAPKVGDPVEIAWGDYVFAQCALTAGLRSRSYHVAARAAAAIACVRSPAGIASYGMLHLHAASRAPHSAIRSTSSTTSKPSTPPPAQTQTRGGWSSAPRTLRSGAPASPWRTVSLDAPRNTHAKSTSPQCTPRNDGPGCTSMPAVATNSPATRETPYAPSAPLTTSPPVRSGYVRRSARSSARWSGTRGAPGATTNYANSPFASAWTRLTRPSPSSARPDRMRIAITGHAHLPADTPTLVDAALRDELARHCAPSLVGVSLLADGPDQLFARAVLDLGGRLDAIAVQREHRHFDEGPFVDLIARATTVRHMPAYSTAAHAWTAAAEELLAGVDLLIAVWDGSEPARNGGTADVVARATELDIAVRVIWPSGARRHISS